MNCRKVQNLISAYVDSEMPGMEMLAVRLHLSECEECRAEFESLLQLKRAFGTLNPKRPAEDFATRICAQLEQIEIPAQTRFLTAVRKRFTFAPGNIRLAVTMCMFAALLAIRVGNINPNNYTYVPEYSGHSVQTAVLHSPLFPSPSQTVEAGSLKNITTAPWKTPIANVDDNFNPVDSSHLVLTIF